MFLETKSCPKDISGWKTREKDLNCSLPNEVYHCLRDEYGRLGETCTNGLASWVQKDYCPVYNRDTNNVNTVLCNMSTDCPHEAFKSNEVYKYPVCLQGRYTSTTAVPRPRTTSSVHEGDSSSLPWHIIGVALGTVFLLALIVVALLCYRKRRTQKTTNGKYEQIPLLSRGIPFYNTSSFHEANSFLKDGGKILCLIGQWGSGKSTTATKVYMSLTGRKPIVIEDILKFDVSTCQESVIVEEPLPIKDISDVEKKIRVEKIISLCKHILESNQTFMIITSTKEAWKTIADEVRNCDFDENEYRCIDLNWKNLSKGDRIQIFHTIFQYYNPDTTFSKVEGIVTRINNNNVGFPEVCTLFSKCREFQRTGVVFCNRPLRNLSANLGKMCQTEKDKFFVLVYMSLNDMKIDMNKSNDKLWEIFRSCGLNTGSVHLKSIIPWEFVVEEEPSVYVLQHEIIKRMTLRTFGKFYFSDLLRFSSRKDLKGWIKQKKKTFMVSGLLEGGSKQASKIEPFLDINDEQWIEYQEKMGTTPKGKCEKSE